jgi:hypothetical protein
MELYFDGYCPESFLKDKQVDMRLNEDDFWESEATGLQVTAHPPYATILRWRGSGKFREASDTASDILVGLVMAGASEESGQEIFPDEANVISNKGDLETYITNVYMNREAYETAMNNLNLPIFKAQEKHLQSIPKEQLQKFRQLLDTVTNDISSEHNDEPAVYAIQNMVYELKLIFDFNWVAWKKGRKNLNDLDFEYSDCSLLELSMYLTVIFRADRFMEGTVDRYFANGILPKILKALDESNSNFATT